MIWMERASIALISLLVVAKAYAITDVPGADERNYRVIVERNPFGLKPPPPPPTNAPPPVAT